MRVALQRAPKSIITRQILQRQQSLSPVSAPSLRLQSCSRSLRRVHFLYGSSLATHRHSPHLTVSVSPDIMRRGKMRLYLLAFLRSNFVKEKVKFMDVPTEQELVLFFFPLHHFHTQQQQQQQLTVLQLYHMKNYFSCDKSCPLLPGFHQIQFTRLQNHSVASSSMIIRRSARPSQGEILEIVF